MRPRRLAVSGKAPFSQSPLRRKRSACGNCRTAQSNRPIAASAVSSSAGDEKEELLRLYGLNVGLAFQLVDDVLDFTSDESTLGKPVGSDLKEGKLTLPLIYLMRDGEPRHRKLVRDALGDGNLDASARDEIIQLVRDYHTADRVLEKAHDYAQKARACLNDFPSCEAREALMSIPDYIVERDR